LPNFSREVVSFRTERTFGKRRLIFATAVIATVFVLDTGHAEDQPDNVPTKPYVVKEFRIPDGVQLTDIKLADTTVNLIGEPDSKTFGLAFRGTLTQLRR
jgi:hypothetical protein